MNHGYDDGLINLDDPTPPSGTRGGDFQLNHDGEIDYTNPLAQGHIRMRRLMFFTTGQYQQVYRRAYTATVDDGLIQNLADNIISVSGKPDTINLSAIANQAIRPAPQIDKAISIVNGWDEPRLRFFMELTQPMGSGLQVRYIYTGFTDYVGASMEGAIDPDMPMHITNIVKLVDKTEYRGYTQTSLKGSDSVIVNSHYYADNTIEQDLLRHQPANQREAREVEYLISPKNIVTRAITTGYLSSRGLSGIDDRSGTISALASRNKRAYTIPSHLLSAMINTRVDAMSNDEMMGTGFDLDGSNNPNERQLNYLRDDALTQDPLFRLYQTQSSIMSSATIDYGQLAENFPEVNDAQVCKVVFPSTMRQVSHMNALSELRNHTRDTLDSDDWASGHQETILATAICQQLPNLMIASFIDSIRFTVTNHLVNSLDEEFNWIIGDDRYHYQDNRTAVTFVTELPTDFQRRCIYDLQKRVEYILLKPWTLNGDIPISLTVDCDTSGECMVLISLAGGQEYKYIMPTFTDSFTSSNITCDPTGYEVFSDDVIHLVDSALELNGNRKPTGPNIIIP